jgi:hypothetical protein
VIQLTRGTDGRGHRRAVKLTDGVVVMDVLRITSLAAVIHIAAFFASGNAAAADPSKWNCASETRDGAEVYACRECGPPQPEADDLQICQVYDFTVGVDAHKANETELVIIVTPYLVRAVDQPVLFRPPDRLELRRLPAAKN